VQGDLISQIGPIQIWATPLADGSRAVILFNRHTFYTYYNSTITVQFTDLGFEPGTSAQVRDLYGRQNIGVFVDSFSWPVVTHDVFVAKITPTTMNPSYVNWRPWKNV